MVHGIFDDIFSCSTHLLIPVRFSCSVILKRQQQSSKIFVQQRQMVEDVRGSKSVRCKFKRLKCIFRPRFFNNLVQLSQWVSVEKREKRQSLFTVCAFPRVFSYPQVALFGGKFHQLLTGKICLKRTLPQHLPASPFEFKMAQVLIESLSWIERRGWVANAS